ncbi:hypothetical protein [Nocardioides sp. zg-1228]|uniref:hypothetical protein n=1 Tax=Nocardioides sp. zg-1228 TaxID=2763008 RepID=UPI001643386A|nr:hypothetical protein [Nocardioides sp. zg-1228]MBC2933563.1 hypothetical protein [Nocardioides sp. zg-1228]QSF56309.1 hypothetical protein JX575_11595 [Nocardioides sp. zg-1228]
MVEGQRLVLLDQVRDWCADSRTKVTIRPVIDLNTELTAAGYDVPDKLREQGRPPGPHLCLPVVHPPR